MGRSDYFVSVANDTRNITTVETHPCSPNKTIHQAIAKPAQLKKSGSDFPQHYSQTGKKASNVPENLHGKIKLWHTEYEDTMRSSGTKET